MAWSKSTLKIAVPAPSTMLRMVPLPRFAGEENSSAVYHNRATPYASKGCSLETSTSFSSIA